MDRIKRTFRITVLFTILFSGWLFAQGFPVLQGSYLGQKPPGLEPKRFVPEPLLSTSSWWWHGIPVFSPDGTEMYFGKYIKGTANNMVIECMKLKNGRWTAPKTENFSGEKRSNCPVFSSDGERLYFWSDRDGGDIFYVQRAGINWSEPVKLNIPVPASLHMGHFYSFNRNMDIYLELWENRNLQLYRALYTNGIYNTPESLGDKINTDHLELSPYINPDEEYIIFASNRPGGYGANDLYISFKNPDGTWSEAVNMGESINSDDEDAFPFITLDKKYFFFASKKEGDVMFNPYWVDAKIIEKYKIKK